VSVTPASVVALILDGFKQGGGNLFQTGKFGVGGLLEPGQGPVGEETTIAVTVFVDRTDFRT